MSRKGAQIIDALREILKQDAIVLDGIVSDIDETAYTCTVTMADGHQLFLVQLKALKDTTDGVVYIPTEGTTVQILQLPYPDWMVIAAEQIDKAIVKIGSTTHTITADGYSIARGDETLKKLLNDLLTAITQLTVPTPAGVSSPPVNISDFQQIQQRISNLLI